MAMFGHTLITFAYRLAEALIALVSELIVSVAPTDAIKQGSREKLLSGGIKHFARTIKRR